MPALLMLTLAFLLGPSPAYAGAGGPSWPICILLVVIGAAVAFFAGRRWK